MDEILVPKDTLSDGFEKSKNHVEFLLESSKILYDKKKYSLCIPILVLGIEECYKMRFILNHITKDVGITKSEWNDITKGRDVHKSKLKKVYSESKKEIEEHGEKNYKIIASFMAKMGDKTTWKSYPEYIKISQYVEERLAKLDVIKQDCFYLGWKKTDWYNFIQISPKQREALAYYLLYFLKMMFNLTVFDHNYPIIETNENSRDFKALKNDPVLKQIMELLKIKKTKEYKIKETLAVSTIDNYQTPNLNTTNF